MDSTTNTTIAASQHRCNLTIPTFFIASVIWFLILLIGAGIHAFYMERYPQKHYLEMFDRWISLSTDLLELGKDIDLSALYQTPTDRNSTTREHLIACMAELESLNGMKTFPYLSDSKRSREKIRAIFDVDAKDYVVVEKVDFGEMNVDAEMEK